MAEVTNTNMEKHFFIYILENPEQFSKVESYYFNNNDIMFVYSVIREEYLRSEKHIVPSPKQIFSMVKLADTENKINDKVLQLLLKSDNSDMSLEWLLPRFKAWKIKNKINEDIVKGIELVRGIENVNLNDATEIAQKLKNIFNNTMVVDDDDDDLGLDFDDPESHKQEISKNSIQSGWSCIDGILGGGWFKSTFNVIMGETNVGKCSHYQTVIKIRNKKSGEIQEISIGDFYKNVNQH